MTRLYITGQSEEGWLEPLTSPTSITLFPVPIFRHFTTTNPSYPSPLGV